MGTARAGAGPNAGMVPFKERAVPQISQRRASCASNRIQIGSIDKRSAVTPASLPVTRFFQKRRDRENQDFVLELDINQRELELLGKYAPSSVFIRRTDIWKFGNERLCCLDGFVEAFAKTPADC
jgi:hypothetical protein